MLYDLKVYKEIIKAIKVSQANMDLENDMNNLNLDKKELKKKLLADYEIINKARNKVDNNE